MKEIHGNVLARLALGIHYARQGARPYGLYDFKIAKHMEKVKDLYEYLKPIADAFIHSDKTDIQNYRHRFHIMYLPKSSNDEEKTILVTYTSQISIIQRDTSIEFMKHKIYGISCTMSIDTSEIMSISLSFGLDKFSTSIDLSFIDHQVIIDKYFDYGQKKLFELVKWIIETHKDDNDYYLHEAGLSLVVKKKNIDRLKEMFDDEDFDIGDIVFIDYKMIKLYRDVSMPRRN